MSDGLRWTEEDLSAYLRRRGRVKSEPTLADSSPSMRPRKYRNTPVEFDGMKFDSEKEARHFQALRIRERLGDITDLKRQVEFPLFACQRATGILMIVAKYVADMTYREDGQLVVEDVKSEITRKNQTYRLKVAWLLAQDGIQVKER